MESSPAIGAMEPSTSGLGTVIFTQSALTVKKWAFKTGDWVILPSDRNRWNHIPGSDDNNLYAISPDGSKKWAFKTNDDVRSSPAIGTDGTIYVGSNDGYLYAINPDGSKNGDSSMVTGCPPCDRKRWNHLRRV